MHEDDLKTEVHKCLNRHFNIETEVEGVFEYDGEVRTVYADFIIEPKETLVRECNLPMGKYVIETKYLNVVSVPDLANLFIQCLTYKQSKFNGESPIAVFIYTNLEYKLFPPNEETRMLEVLLNTLGRRNIGRLEIKKSDFNLIFHNNDILIRYKYGKYKNARRDLLSISFGSGNNKLINKYI